MLNLFLISWSPASGDCGEPEYLREDVGAPAPKEEGDLQVLGPMDSLQHELVSPA